MEKEAFSREYKFRVLLTELGLSQEDFDQIDPLQIKGLVKARLKDKGDRTEMEKALDFASVRLGGQDYTIKLLPISKSFEWRKRAGRFVAQFVDSVKGMDLSDKESIDISSIVKQMLPEIMTVGVDELIDLMFSYAPALPKQDIMRRHEAGEIRSAELVTAAMGVFRLEIPFFTALAKELFSLIQS